MIRRITVYDTSGVAGVFQGNYTEVVCQTTTGGDLVVTAPDGKHRYTKGTWTWSTDAAAEVPENLPKEPDLDGPEMEETA